MLTLQPSTALEHDFMELPPGPMMAVFPFVHLRPLDPLIVRPPAVDRTQRQPQPKRVPRARRKRTSG